MGLRELLAGQGGSPDEQGGSGPSMDEYQELPRSTAGGGGSGDIDVQANLRTWKNIVRGGTLIAGLAAIGASIYFSARGFGFVEKGDSSGLPFAMGLLLGLKITILEFSFHRYRNRTGLTLKVLGFIAYTYGVITNFIGLVLIFIIEKNKSFSANSLEGLATIVLYIAMALLLEIAPEYVVSAALKPWIDENVQFTFLRVGNVVMGLAVLLISIYYTALGFGAGSDDSMAIGVILAVFITVFEFLWSIDTTHPKLFVIVVGLIYVAGIFFNFKGLLALADLPNILKSVATFMQAVALFVFATMMEIGPEPMIAFGVTGGDTGEDVVARMRRAGSRSSSYGPGG